MYRSSKSTSPRILFLTKQYTKVPEPSDLLTQGVLPNKMRYTILPRVLEPSDYEQGPPYLNADPSTKTPPPPSIITGTFSLAMHIEVGSLDEEEEERGLAHFVEHLCFDASNKFNKRYGIWSSLDLLGVRANAFTTTRSTVYEHFDVMNDSVTTKGVFEIAREQLLYTIPTQVNINIEKGAVLGEQRMRNNTESIVDDRELCSFFGLKSTICQRLPIGVIQTVEKFNVNKVKTFLNKWYHPERTHLFIAGDVQVSQIVPLLQDIFGRAQRGDGGVVSVRPGAAGVITPKRHGNISKGSEIGVYSMSPFSENRMKNRTKREENKAQKIDVYSDVLGMDGVEFRVTVADPVHGTYYDEASTSGRHLRNVHEILFSYVYAHVVSESVVDRHDEIDAMDPMLDYDVSSGLSDDFDRNARTHGWRIRIGNGFGGEKGAASVISVDNEWRAELESSLVELRRMSMYGPDRTLLKYAMLKYKKRNQRKTDTFYMKKSTSDLVAEMYGDRSREHVWRSPWEIEKEEKDMVHSSMLETAFMAIQAEAELLWQSIVRLFLGSDWDGGGGGGGGGDVKGGGGEGLARRSPRVVFTCIHAPELQRPPTISLMTKIVRRVATLVLSPPKESTLEDVKSDHDLMDDQEKEAARMSSRRRKYVRRSKQQENQWRGGRGVTKGATRESNWIRERSRVRGSGLSLKSNEEEEKEPGGLGDSGGGDDGTLTFQPYLIDVDHLVAKRDVMLSVMAEGSDGSGGSGGGSSKRKRRAANETRRRGAFQVVEKETKASSSSLLTRWKLLNGIGVNVVRASELGVSHTQRGQVSLEIVSLGGRATVDTSLFGACRLVSSKNRVAEGFGVQYSDNGGRTNSEDDEDDEEYTSLQVDEVMRSTEENSSDQKDTPLISSNSTHGPPSSSSSIHGMKCEEEHLILSMMLTPPCKNDVVVCVPSLDRRAGDRLESSSASSKSSAVTTSWSATYVPDLILARLHLRPRFTTRSIRREYVTMVEEEATQRRDTDPATLAKSHAAPMLLARHLDGAKEEKGEKERRSKSDVKSIFGDVRLREPASSDLAKLDPTAATRWVREQFTPDRMEINIVGDLGTDDKVLTALLHDLNLVFGTMSPFNTTGGGTGGGRRRLGRDPYSEKDVQHFAAERRAFPAKSSTSTTVAKRMTDESCYVPHLYGRRSYLTMVMPSHDALVMRKTMMSKMTTHLTERLAWSVVRKQNGLSYAISTKSFHSFLFPGFGYTSVSVEVGQYGAVEGGNDPMNVGRTMEAIKSSFGKKRGYDKALFTTSREQLTRELAHDLSSNMVTWMKIVRGMSLRVAASMRKTLGGEATTMTMMLKDVDQINVVESVERTQLESFVQWTRKHGPTADNVMLTSLVETVDLNDVPFHSEDSKECEAIPF